MAYSEKAAERVRAVMKRRKGFSERRMFGGVAFMLGGHMCCGVIDDDLVLRLGETETERALREQHVRPMDFTGTALRTMVYVSAEAFASDESLRAWVDRAVRFVRTLPPKPSKKENRRPKAERKSRSSS